MKINPISNKDPLQTYKVGVGRNTLHRSGTPMQQDEVSISEEAKGMSFRKTLDSLADEIGSPTDVARVAALKDQVRRGVYDIPGEAVAEKILRGTTR